MKTLPGNGKVSGLTLIEVLVVIVVVLVLLAMIPPSGTKKRPAFLVKCLSNQRQIAIGYTMWKGDHGNKFPWELPVANGGTMEFSEHGYAATNFNLIMDYVKQPQIFICPTDQVKTTVTNGVPVGNQNISYLLGLDSGTNELSSILTGDRHLSANSKPVKPGLFVYSISTTMNWTRELHNKAIPEPKGVLCFWDGHGEIIPGKNLNSIFQRQGLVTNRFAIP